VARVTPVYPRDTAATPEHMHVLLPAVRCALHAAAMRLLARPHRAEESSLLALIVLWWLRRAMGAAAARRVAGRGWATASPMRSEDLPSCVGCRFGRGGGVARPGPAPVKATPPTYA